jgi:hypothetical protein
MGLLRRASWDCLIINFGVIMLAMRKALLFCSLLFLLSVPLGAQQVLGATATVYFYRNVDAPGPRPSIYIDDVKAAKLRNGEYFILRMGAGEHTLYAGDKQPNTVILEPNEVYYFRTEGGFYGHQTRLTRVYPEQGAFDIEKLSQISVETH